MDNDKILQFVKDLAEFEGITEEEAFNMIGLNKDFTPIPRGDTDSARKLGVAIQRVVE